MGEPNPYLLKEEALAAVLEEYRDRFREIPPGLPPEREIAHPIPTEPGARPPNQRAYRMSPVMRDELEEQIAYLLEMGYIQPSASPYGAPVLFVPKPGGKWRMVVDYRALNRITVRDKYPLPRIDALLDDLSGAKVFSSIDLASGYWQIRIPEEDRHKTAFQTPLGLFEYTVLPMGLTNAPATFQRLMNQLLNRFMRHGPDGERPFVCVYLDDILIYNRSAEEHERHLRAVLQVLREADLYAKES